MQPTRLFDTIYFQKENYPQSRAFGHELNGEWIYFSTDEAIELINQASRGLLALGVQPGDKIGVISYKNRPEWTFMDIAIQQIGAIVIPVYPTISSREYEYIFNDSEVTHVFVGPGDLFDKVEATRSKVSTLKNIYTFDPEDGKPHWKSIFTDEGQEKVDQIKAGIKPEDLATLIYTSGTTGNPKGVMLSHQNIMSNVIDVGSVFPIQPGDVTLSFLPLCHVFERTASFAYTYLGFQTMYTGTDNLGGEAGDLRKIRPHYFNTVPRLLEKVYEKIYNKGLSLTGAKRNLFFWALSLTEDFEYGKSYGFMGSLKRSIADKLIFSKWREALGGRIKGILTGAAPCPVKMARVFSAAGIPIREGYGLTETSPGLTIGRFESDGAMLGTIGPALPSVELMIDTEGDYREGEGEILAHGPNVMMGYYNLPEKTAEVMKEIDGKKWFCTGDIGMMVKGPTGEPFLKITDRKKELLKTSGGKYVAPAPIENKFKENFLIEQMIVIGDKQKFVSALIVPSDEALKDWCKTNNIAWKDCASAICEPKVKAYYQGIIDELNPLFSHIEQIKKFELVPDKWEPTKTDGSVAELTPTMKLKRRVIVEKYKPVIEQIYSA